MRIILLSGAAENETGHRRQKRANDSCLNRRAHAGEIPPMVRNIRPMILADRLSAAMRFSLVRA